MNDVIELSNESTAITRSPEWSGMSLWNIINGSSEILPTTLTTRRTDAVVVRNLLIGGLGILFNSIAITFLCLTKKVKLTIKATMIGMTLNDLCFTTNALVLGNPTWIWISEAPHCWPVMYFVVSPMLVSNLTTVLLAVHNFVAVVYPLHCELIMTKKRSILFVMACWVVGYLVVFGCLGTTFPKGLLCFVLIVMPRYGLAVFCGSCLVCCGFIVSLNVIIGKKVRDSGKMLRQKLGSESKHTGHNTKTTTQPANDGREDGERKVNTRRVINLEKNKLNSNISASEILTLKNVSNDQMVRSEQLRQQENNSNNIFNNGSSTTNMVINQPKTDLAPHEKDPHPKKASDFTKSVRTQSRTRRVKTSITLMLLTFWSCFLSLPLVVFMIYVALLAPDRQIFTTSDAGYLIAFVSAIHSVGNPMLYAWRFINWGIIRNRLAQVSVCF